MDAKERARLRALCEAATPGPWHARTGRTYADGKVTSVEHYIARGDDDVGIASEVCDSRTGQPSADNALFIAASRTALPALLDALDAVERERDEARAEAERLRALVGAANDSEREACAALCDGIEAEAEAEIGSNDRRDWPHTAGESAGAYRCAEAIRARGAGCAR